MEDRAALVFLMTVAGAGVFGIRVGAGSAVASYAPA